MTSSTRSPSIEVGSYQLLERVGEGGTSHVYRAHKKDGETVALKLLSPNSELDDSGAKARFLREIRVLATLDCPRLPHLLDHGVDDELGPYLVMPFYDGTTLRAHLAGAALCPEAVLLLLLPMLEGLEALHAHGLVHRDLKPENLMATKDGRVMLVDLGLVYGKGQTRHTEEGSVVGSIPYMSPEQIENRDITVRSDMWSVGVLAYEWLVGKRPFARGRPTEEAAAALVGQFPSVTQVDRRASQPFAELIESCLSVDPNQRPADAGALLATLRPLLDWFDPADTQAELAALLDDAHAYQQRVAAFRVEAIRQAADDAIERGKSFAALKWIDRGLAYAPDDQGLRELAERAEADRPRTVKRQGKRWMLAIAVVAVCLAVGAGFMWFPNASEGDGGVAGDSDTNIKTAVTLDDLDPATLQKGKTMLNEFRRRVDEGPVDKKGPPSKADKAARNVAHGFIDLFEEGMTTGRADSEQGHDAAKQVVGGLFDLFTEGLKAQAKETAETPQRSRRFAKTIDTIPVSALGNRDPDRGQSLLRRPGTRLVPESMLDGGATTARAMIERELKKHPGDAKFLTGKSMILMGSGHEAQGLQLLDKLRNSDPDHESVLAAIAYVDIRRGKFASAERALKKSIGRDARDASARRNLGILQHRLGRSRDAYRTLLDAIAIDDRDAEALTELAQIFQRAGRKHDALPILLRIVRLRPRSVVAWIDLSVLQEPSEAKRSAKRALRLEPNSPRANRRLCSVLSQLDDAATRRACSKSIRLDRSPGSYMARGLHYYKSGDDERALRDIDRALRARPKNVVYLKNRYLVRSHAGRLQEANEDLRRACVLGDRQACDEKK